MSTRLCLFYVSAALAARGLAAADDAAKLKELRSAYAERFCEPAPHVALAKHLHDRGHRLVAFFILEGARKRFSRWDAEKDEGEWTIAPDGQPSFEQAFEHAFLGKELFDNSKEAEEALRTELGKTPRSAKLLQRLADVHISRREYAEARAVLEKLLEVEPDDFGHVDALAEVLDLSGDEKGARAARDLYARKHPGSREDYQLRLDALMRDDRPAARKLLEEALRKFPGDGELLFNLGVILQDEKKLEEAEKTFLQAASLTKGSAHVQGWVGRFLLKVQKKEALALEHYLNAYFLDPHFYDSEFAESRIRKLAWGAAGARLKALKAKGTLPAKLLADENPVVVGMVLEELAADWKPELLEPILALLSHDDESLRWSATEALREHAGAAFEPRLTKLLKDPDHRRRGAAAFVAMRLRKSKAIPQLAPWLSEESQLLRFDVISAFAESRDAEARKLLEQHREREKHPHLREILKNLDRAAEDE